MFFQMFLGTYLQRELACCIRYSVDKCGEGKMMVYVCREDLLKALLTARESGTRSGCSVVGWQPVQRVSFVPGFACEAVWAPVCP